MITELCVIAGMIAVFGYIVVYGARAPARWFENRLLDLLQKIQDTDSLQVLRVNHQHLEVVLKEKKDTVHHHLQV
ncbi:MAG: hypothetical protein PHS79_00565 [Patescibacteria group bacterium]|nr:hypothetical protein [Patescibacteria group bacterium]